MVRDFRDTLYKEIELFWLVADEQLNLTLAIRVLIILIVNQ